jgi:hypothetical protein
MLEFDMLNIDPNDAADGDLSLDWVEIARQDIGILSGREEAKTYSFDGGTPEGWSAHGADPFSMPAFSIGASSLNITGLAENTNVYGYWTSPWTDVSIDPAKLYIATFDVSSNVSEEARSQVPLFRVRLNETGFRQAAILAVESRGNADRSPVEGAPQQYVLYLLPSQAAAGEGLISSFDFINIDPIDQSDATLRLENLVIETVPNPFLVGFYL